LIGIVQAVRERQHDLGPERRDLALKMLGEARFMDSSRM